MPLCPGGRIVRASMTSPKLADGARRTTASAASSHFIADTLSGVGADRHGLASPTNRAVGSAAAQAAGTGRSVGRRTRRGAGRRSGRPRWSVFADVLVPELGVRLDERGQQFHALG